MEAATDLINTAFAEITQLRKRIFDAIDETPQHLQLFHDIAAHHLSSTHGSIADTAAGDTAGPPVKKRKLEVPEAENISHQSLERVVILEARDLSFTLPQRKKLHLSIVQYGKSFDSPATTFALCVRNPATDQVEIEMPVNSIAHAIRVPVPEKIQKQFNFCVLPAQKDSETTISSSGEGIIWSVNQGPLKSLHIHSTDLEAIVGSEDVLEKALSAILQRSGNKLVLPDETQFASAVPEAHRKHEKAYHVKAHRGSKDGYLFFLENGIFFGFKKPLAFFAFHEIDSVSYTAVLQRTFNLLITTQTNLVAAEPQEVEFAMLDQLDFAGIDAYIKEHQLQDASLAEARRAKQFKVNGKTTTDENEGAEGQSELQRAEAELEDEEDELEEDYDPGSEGESEGSGYSEEEDGDDEGGGNLVEEELGSEAEEISEDGEEEEELEDEDEEGNDERPEAIRKPSKPTPSIPMHPIPVHPVGAPEVDDADQL